MGSRTLGCTMRLAWCAAAVARAPSVRPPGALDVECLAVDERDTHVAAAYRAKRNSTGGCSFGGKRDWGLDSLARRRPPRQTSAPTFRGEGDAFLSRAVSSTAPFGRNAGVTVALRRGRAGRDRIGEWSG